MSDERPGDPRSVRHLRPQMGQLPPTPLGDPEEMKQALGEGAGPIYPTPDEDTMITEVTSKLRELRKPFPPERIEKLPKPMFKGAWDGKRGANCPECHGYHVLDHAIHLDYVGHANVTDRLLEVDPFWYWEPMALTEQGTPLFSNGGLWIRLTVCGMTRIGFGDGANPKEIIGDGIRNAAMRFGVGLDLWAKIDLHSERNPGDGETPVSRASQPRGDGRPNRPNGDDQPQAATPAPNREALDSLGSVCDSEGLDRRQMRAQYYFWAKDRHPDDTDLLKADSEHILLFAAYLIEQATAQPDASEPGVGSADESGDDGVAEAPVAAGELSADPTDTSDVEPKPEDLF